MKTKINPANFTKTVGAYSQAIKVDVGDKVMIFVSGQLAMDAEGNPVVPDDISQQTRFIFENIKKILAEAGAKLEDVVFENIKKILAEAGAKLEDVVKVQIFMTDISKFPQFTVVRNEYLEHIKPVSTLVEISKTVKVGCDVEIEVIAVAEK